VAHGGGGAEGRDADAPRVGLDITLLFTTLLLCVKTHLLDDSHYGRPCNQSDTPRE
jgi:hypothetical protein